MERQEHEKVLEKIKKLFELANNNPSEEEARSAALKAQELMAQYDVELEEIENTDLNKTEEIDTVKVEVPAKKWKYALAHTVADNFKCKFYLNGKSRIVFFGHKTDAHIAAETFKFLFNMGNRLANKLYREARDRYERTENIYNSCVMGFVAGVREALAEQSKALMVLVPEDVKKEYADFTRGFKVSHTSRPSAYRGDAFNRGRTAGYNAMKRNALEGGN